MVDISKFLVNTEFIKSIHNNNLYNETIFDYYSQLYSELNEFNKKNKFNLSKSRGSRLISCNRIWLLDRYDFNQIKDFKSTNLCKDKFCNNCKKVKQASRMSRYIPYIEPFKDNLYHLVLTVPNVESKELKTTLERMASSFRRLIQILNKHHFISGIDLSDLEYQGAVKSLEITFNNELYHPHYHIALALNGNINIEDKTFTNKYSYNKFSSKLRQFSHLEILIQKIWFLIYNNLTVSKENIDSLDEGYSCTIDKFQNSDYAELFKYMTKGTNEDNQVLSYDNFKTLYISTHKKKQIQGYGCFYRINDDDLEQEVDKIYLDIQNFLTKEESATEIFQRPFELLDDHHYQIISRKKIYQYLREIKDI